MQKTVREIIEITKSVKEDKNTDNNKDLTIQELTEMMYTAAKNLDFEKAAMLRDKIESMKK